MKEYTVSFRPLGRRVLCSAGATLLDCCRANQIPLASTCGGQGKCHSCKVRIESGTVVPPSGNELKILTAGELKSGWRMACQVKPAGDLTVYLPGGDDLASTPAFRGRLLTAIVPDARGGRRRSGLGAAIDLGTTKIAGYLVDLSDGRVLGSRAMANPQAAYGDDVVSRITYAMRSPSSARKLKDTAITAIDSLIADLSALVGQGEGNIRSVVVCGNTAMHHLVLGLPVGQLARAPYLPWVKDPVNIRAEGLGLKSVPGARVYFLPNIGGYVGGDHVAVLSSTGAPDFRAAALVIDIGTNTEISLASAGAITSVSCASGPAFEGGHIKFGMKASPGAIDKIIIKGDKIRYRAIGGGKPVGICGSGMLDAVAQMAGERIIDPGGRMAKAHPLVSLNEGQLQVRVTGGRETSGGQDIVITQGDVREMQLAKAAIRTGIDVLLRSAGIAAPDVKRIIIAGTFGNYIDVNSAVRIGMFPHLPLRRFSQVGNAAGAGACLVLVSALARKKMEDMARRVNYLELAGRPDFMELYVEALKIRP